MAATILPAIPRRLERWFPMVFSTVAICDQFVERNVFSRRAGRDNRHTKSSMTEFLC